MRRLNGQHLIKTIGYAESEQHNTHDFFFIMQKMDGGTLQQLFASPALATTPLLTRLGYMLDLARGLSRLHQQDCIHTDLKPDNLFLHQGSLKIGDFGISVLRCVQTNQMVSGVDVSSADYLPPEYFQEDSPKGTFIDIYSYGLIFNHLFTGQPH